MLHSKRIIHLRAPLRLSFVGGGTDFPGYFARKPGLVISATIDAFVYVTIKDMFDTNVRVHHSVIETEPISSRISHLYTRTALEHFGLFKGTEVIIVSDVMTTGSGLGASSALMSALGLGSSLLRNHPMGDQNELAQLTCKLEEKAGTVGGQQDQYAACFGGLNAINFNGKGVSVDPLAVSPDVLSELEERTLLVFTNLARDSHPIQVSVAEQAGTTDKDEYLAQLYQATVAFQTELLSQKVDFAQLGRILDDTWRLKKEISPLSTNLYIDELYGLLRSHGVLGGKVTGAGGGGFFLALTESVEAKRSLLYRLYPNYIGMDIKFHRTGTEVLWKNF
jgi:D-glycero-alpha-D-manno-heptose-7-phosphate kinase